MTDSYDKCTWVGDDGRCKKKNPAKEQFQYKFWSLILWRKIHGKFKNWLTQMKWLTKLLIFASIGRLVHQCSTYRDEISKATKVMLWFAQPATGLCLSGAACPMRRKLDRIIWKYRRIQSKPLFITACRHGSHLTLAWFPCMRECVWLFKCDTLYFIGDDAVEWCCLWKTICMLW